MRSLTSVALGWLAVVAAPAVLAEEQTSGWQPAPARLAKLGPETKTEGWSLRPPKGWEHRVKREATESRYPWDEEGLGVLALVRPAAGPLQRTPDDAMDSAPGALKARTKGLKLAEPDRGTLGGRPFVRVRSRMDPQPQLQGMDSGFVYATAVAWSQAGMLSVKLEGKGPFSILLLADRSDQALIKGNGGMDKKDMLLDIQSSGASYSGEVKVLKGTAWIIVENRSGQAADFHLG